MYSNRADARGPGRPIYGAIPDPSVSSVHRGDAEPESSGTRGSPPGHPPQPPFTPPRSTPRLPRLCGELASLVAADRQIRRRRRRAFGGLANQTVQCVRFLAEMRPFRWLRIGALAAAICGCVPGQSTQSKDPQIETKGMAPRTSATEYEAQAEAGALTIGAEFAGHGIPSPQGPLALDNYVAIEVGLFGAPGARTTVSATDFSLRINGKKAEPSQAYGRVLEFVKDPEWAPPVQSRKSPKPAWETPTNNRTPTIFPSHAHRSRSRCRYYASGRSAFKSRCFRKGTVPCLRRGYFLPVRRQGQEHLSARAAVRRSGWKGRTDAPPVVKRG